MIHYFRERRAASIDLRHLAPRRAEMGRTPEDSGLRLGQRLPGGENHPRACAPLPQCPAGPARGWIANRCVHSSAPHSARRSAPTLMSKITDRRPSRTISAKVSCLFYVYDNRYCVSLFFKLLGNGCLSRYIAYWWFVFVYEFFWWFWRVTSSC